MKKLQIVFAVNNKITICFRLWGAELSSPSQTALPHKTIATRAGIGWIGKSALLVTAKYGSAIRLSSILTDTPIETASCLLL